LNPQFNPAIANLLIEHGVEQMTARTLSEKTDMPTAQAWCAYARQKGLGAGYIVSRLRGGDAPPAGRHCNEIDPRRYISGQYADIIRH
jgi:hypothetical protein